MSREAVLSNGQGSILGVHLPGFSAALAFDLPLEGHFGVDFANP